MLRESHEDNLKNFLLFIVIMLYNQMIITPQGKMKWWKQVGILLLHAEIVYYYYFYLLFDQNNLKK